ncbi:hypothetical protein [Burkholderia cenocepacia]|uniref:hypothetical protein n=1 Tax=Burkholderia cenocepacia TaxID=95486 RepID=UPI00222F1247|nr:hypothetical protein [Burkholderia cenocepacia]MCW3502071.1 hypothetical protein [Burkholderia cenocepacia]MCW3509459.1 hypothetical protein [Burkholderia cenocepacia]MCW3517156.1 hypothetical protein [Burkholderia cenocepacia]MCW3532641.1 hypothetical protein [Burkholderia cenocepacia]MCW3547965.1 hypothetical protein [Burkholderia cenocepacia]
MSLVHWTYKEKSTEDLEQGDLLEKTAYILDNVLAPFHPYYAKHPDNIYFIVLTQSCDLVRRGGECKSEYLALAPVRPLRVILEREFASQIRNVGASSTAYAAMSTKTRYQDFLAKVFNNNYPKYFFLQSQPDRGLAEDMCAVLPLSISIKAEHYDECIKARRLQLDDAFQAKLGYLIGQQYAKVGTRDWDENAISEKVDDIIKKTAVWVPDADMGALADSIAEFQGKNNGEPIDDVKLNSIIGNLPTKKGRAVDAIMEFLVSQNLVSAQPSKERFNVRKALVNNAKFSQFFREQ